MKKYQNKLEDYERINECETFGGFLANLRKYYKLTQPQLGEKLNINYKAISKWENDTNFPDVGIHKSICDIFNITLDEFYSGKIDIEFRKRNARSKNVKKILLILTIFLLPSVFLFVTLLWKNYDTLNLYSIIFDEKTDTNINVRGLFIDYQDSDFLYIGNIDLLNISIQENDIINIEFMYDNKIFYSSNVLSNISVIAKNNFAKDLKKFSINVKIIRDGVVKYNKKVKLKFAKQKLDSYKEETNNKEKSQKTNIKNSLLKDGFLETDKEIYVKNIKDDKSLKTITILLETKRIVYTEENKTISKSINFKGENNTLEVKIAQIYDSIRTVLESYNYSYDNDELLCYTKICPSHVDVLKFMYPYVSLFISDTKSP